MDYVENLSSFGGGRGGAGICNIKVLPEFKDTAKQICWLPLCWLVEREIGKGKGKIHLPFFLCMRSPEWNSLCWLVKRWRKKDKEENGPWGERVR
jgi:hypothetical protein